MYMAYTTDKQGALAGIRIVPQDLFLILQSTRLEVTANVKIDGAPIPIVIETDLISWEQKN